MESSVSSDNEHTQSKRSDGDHIFDFEKWITANQLEEIKDCLIDYDMDTFAHLTYSNALELVNDERIKKRPQIIPVLMASILSIGRLEIMLSTQSPNQTQSAAVTPISRLSPAASPKSTNTNQPLSLYMHVLEERLDLDDTPFPDVETPKRSTKKKGKRPRSASAPYSPKKKQVRFTKRDSEPLSGLNIPLSGLDLRDCERDNFNMNIMDMHSHPIDNDKSNEQSPLSIRSWILNLFFHIFLILFIYFQAMGHKVSLIFVVLMTITWCAYTFEWIVINPGISITQYEIVYDKETLYKEIQQLIDVQPNIKWRIRCYHAERKKNKENEYGMDESELVRVDTLEENVTYSYTSCKDISKEFPKTSLEQYGYTKLRIHKSFRFANKITERDYYHRAEVFRKDNDNHDDYQYFEQWMDLKGWIGYKEEAYKQITSCILVKTDGKKGNRCISTFYMRLFSCFMCSACYRTYIAKKIRTEKMDYIIEKEISL